MGQQDQDLKQREFDHRVELEKRSIRTEPLGLDRHHRRYWWLKGNLNIVYPSVNGVHRDHTVLESMCMHTIQQLLNGASCDLLLICM